MAAAIIPIVGTVLQIVAPYLPVLIQTIENLFGHSSTTGSKDGPDKLAAVVAAAQTLLTSLASAGKIPSGGVVDPTLPAALAADVQKVVDAMKAAGLLGGTVAVPTIPVIAQPQPVQVTPTQSSSGVLSSSIASGAGHTFIILEVS